METSTAEVIEIGNNDEQDLFYSLLAEDSTFYDEDYVVDFDDWSM